MPLLVDQVRLISDRMGNPRVRESEPNDVIHSSDRLDRDQSLTVTETEDTAAPHDEESDLALVGVDDEGAHGPERIAFRIDDLQAPNVHLALGQDEIGVTKALEACFLDCHRSYDLSSTLSPALWPGASGSSASLGCEYQRDGTRIGTPRFQFRLEADATGSVATSGWGARNPGTWTPGSYLVICSENGFRFSQARFEIR